MSNIYIGLSGVAGAGKDLFFSLFSKKFNCNRYSLADALKKEVSPFSKDSYDIDPLTCSRKEKNLIRPLLVTHGTIKRDRSKGRHWIDKLNKKIKNNLTNQIVIITDIRYDDYPKDEVFWLKEELGGHLVHISLYSLIPRLNAYYRSYREPVNAEEERNDPKIKSKADYFIDWQKFDTDRDSKLEPYIDDFIKWLNEKEDGLSAYKKTEGERL